MFELLVKNPLMAYSPPQTSCESPPNDLSCLYEMIKEEGKNDRYNCRFLGCDKSRVWKSEIERHIMTHFNIKPYVCPFEGCGKAFKREMTLNDHIRGLHTKETTLNCPYPNCELQFTTSAKLKYHIYLHDQEKPYKCSIPGCDWSFVTSSQVKRHEKATFSHLHLYKNTERGPSEATTDTSNNSKNELIQPIEKKVKLEHTSPDSTSINSNFNTSLAMPDKICTTDLFNITIPINYPMTDFQCENIVANNRERSLQEENESLKKKFDDNNQLLLEMKNQMNQMELLLLRCFQQIQMTSLRDKL